MGNRYIEAVDSRQAHPFREDAERLARSFETDAYKDKDLVIRWKKSGNVPPQEVLDFWKHIGKRFNMQKAVRARKRENQAAIEAYRKADRKPSAEEMYEMRAAFGEGAVVVDAITGRKIRL